MAEVEESSQEPAEKENRPSSPGSKDLKDNYQEKEDGGSKDYIVSCYRPALSQSSVPGLGETNSMLSVFSDTREGPTGP